MSNTFFISDTHFGHKNILKFEPYYRQFDTIEEHDQKLIDNWNSVVKTGDIVYHLGDVVFGKENLWKLKALNGSKRLIMGNHDCYDTQDYLQVFDKLYGCLKWNAFVILSHIPVHVNQLNKRFRYNIHGHLHSRLVGIHDDGLDKLVNDPRYINVSVEQIKLTPIEWEDLKEKYIDK